MALVMEVSLGPDHIVLYGDPAPLPKKGQHTPPRKEGGCCAPFAVVPSGECARRKGRHDVYLQVELCDRCLSALSVPWCEKALYNYSSFPVLSFP